MQDSNSAIEQLASAAGSGDVSTLSRLLDEGVDINAKNSLGRTPLISAAAYNQKEVVQILLERGADPSITDDWDTTPARVSSMNEHHEITALIRKHSEKINSINQSSTTRNVVSANVSNDIDYLGDSFVEKCLKVKYRELDDDRWFSHFEELPEIDRLIDDGKKEEALSLILKGLNSYPDSFLFYNRAAKLYDELGKTNEAEQILKEGLLKSRSKCNIADAIADRALKVHENRKAIYWWIQGGAMQIESKNNGRVDAIFQILLMYVSHLDFLMSKNGYFKWLIKQAVRDRYALMLKVRNFDIELVEA